MKRPSLLAAFLFLPSLVFAQAPTVNAAANTLFTGADGKFESAPDTALVQFNISAQADNSKAAYDQVSKQTEQVRQIMTSKELSSTEKLGRLHALIPPDVFKIDSLSTATPEQVRQLRDGLAVTQAMQEIRRVELLAKK